MKEFFRKITPSPIWNSLRFVKRQVILLMSVLHLPLPLKKKRNKIKFEIHLVEHCNLNCKGCNNFSCIAEPEFINIESFRRDMKRMGEIFNHTCERVILLGGEPLLHPEIITLIKTARENFTDGVIEMYTNGILLSKKDADFWQACRDNNIDILISAYPIKIDIERIRELAQTYGVNVQWAWDQEEGERNTFGVKSINLAGDSNIELNFALCGMANYCIALKKGRLFTCQFASNLHHFSKYFKKNIEITEADSVNIYDDFTADEILQKLTEPIPVCRYCRILQPVRTMKWGITEKNISEWL